MNTNPRNQSGRWKFNVLLTVLLFLGGAALWWLPDVRTNERKPDSLIKGLGTLPARDVAEIRRLVRREIWRYVLPQFSWWSIRALPAAIRYRASERISWATVHADGTVEVGTQVDGMVGGQVFVQTGMILKLKKGRNGWQVICRASWIS